jgi:hypothetical protein
MPAGRVGLAGWAPSSMYSRGVQLLATVAGPLRQTTVFADPEV